MSVSPQSRFQGVVAADGGVEVGNNAVIFSGSDAPVDGTSGTYVNLAGIGSLYLDVLNGNAYINAGTLDSPTWKLITRAA